MRSDSIRRKFKLHEDQRRASELPRLLEGLEVLGFVRADELPQQLLDTLADFGTANPAPNQRIYAGTAKPRVDEWHGELLRRAGIGERFFLRTGLEYFPWADCRVTDGRWLDTVRSVLGPGLAFIAHDRHSAALTVPVRYELLGYLTVPLVGPTDAKPAEPAEDNEATVLMSRIEPAETVRTEVAGG
ncbi:hypothetical protein FOH10_19575 [Nocardia otitidiscaviarum]|uniref:Uncharacterized protein n=1 Tax=Nocardia otitidiscaviarum TaxID=1823 RepID=A0A516NNU9_9NOCA|nr:hypothetical protein [Nocardia otitidiscaviarum]MCP9624177.1 hypothetical protein [Nocardia otitidiscaviarum]QDP80590.1 hypothetical protein FOH10_19575 [Nocardia otitidiscaviarum]